MRKILVLILILILILIIVLIAPLAAGNYKVQSSEIQSLQSKIAKLEQQNNELKLSNNNTIDEYNNKLLDNEAKIFALDLISDINITVDSMIMMENINMDKFLYLSELDVQEKVSTLSNYYSTLNKSINQKWMNNYLKLSKDAIVSKAVLSIVQLHMLALDNKDINYDKQRLKLNKNMETLLVQHAKIKQELLTTTDYKTLATKLHDLNKFNLLDGISLN